MQKLQGQNGGTACDQIDDVHSQSIQLQQRINSRFQTFFLVVTLYNLSCWFLIFDLLLYWKDRQKSMTKSYDNMSITLPRLIPPKLMISPQIKTGISNPSIIGGFFLNSSAIKYLLSRPLYCNVNSPFPSRFSQFK